MSTGEHSADLKIARNEQVKGSNPFPGSEVNDERLRAER
jgi:hypothetical protein